MSARTLLDEFIETFLPLDGLHITRDETSSGDIEPLLVAPWPKSGISEWRPRRLETPPAEMAELYRKVGGPVPPLYDQLVRNYVWATVDLGTFRLLGNLPPVPASLEREIMSDAFLFRFVSTAGFLLFGRGPDYDYDPVCFDLRRRAADGDCPIVKLDHEDILTRETLTVVRELAPSFRQLIEDVIRRAAEKI